MSLRALARGYYNSNVLPTGHAPMGMGIIIPYLNADDKLIDGARVIRHPSYRDVEDEGAYEYAYNPDITYNFIYSPANRVDTAPQPTVSSNVIVRNTRPWDDVIITEIWLGGGRELSTLNEMFFVFYEYWMTSTDIGEHIGWCPFDLTSDRFLIDIVSVELGGVDYQYQEVRKYITKNRADTYLNRQLTLRFKLAAPTKLPQGTVTLTGI